MANTRVVKTLADLATFTRPTSANYEDAGGVTQTAGVNVPRFEYLSGVPQGLKFGDGDLLSVPLGGWFNPLEGVGLIRTYSQLGDTVFSAGTVSGAGVNGWKTHVVHWAEGGVIPGDPLKVFPNAPNDGVTRYCAGLLGYVLDLEVDDLVLMENFNAILNGEGF